MTGFPPFPTGTVCALFTGMGWSIWLRRTLAITTLYAIGLAEAYYLPRYGIEIFLGSIAVTVFLAGLWLRTRWYI